jgi:spermidine synthase
MDEITTLAREETERGEVALRRRQVNDGPPVYEIISNGVFLMASSNAFSARELTRLGLQLLEGRGNLRVLVGGLGIGYTLQAALENPEVARVEVVEVEPLIVGWARAYFGPLNGDALEDPRVDVVVDDLAHYLQTTSGSYDALLLDIDNGPTWLVVEENAAVYDRPALERMRSLLGPGGVLGVWAAESSSDFLTDLKRVFDWADEVVVMEVVEGKETEYFIYRAGIAG